MKRWEFWTRNTNRRTVSWSSRSNKWTGVLKIWKLTCLNMNRSGRFNSNKSFISKVIWEFSVESNPLTVLWKRVELCMIVLPWIFLNWSTLLMKKKRKKRLNIRPSNFHFLFKLLMFIILTMCSYLINHRRNFSRKLNLLSKQHWMVKTLVFSHMGRQDQARLTLWRDQTQINYTTPNRKSYTLYREYFLG